MNLRKIFSEAILLTALFTFFVLVLQDLNAILSRVETADHVHILWDAGIWIMFGISCARYFVIILNGLLSRALKKISDKETSQKEDKLQAVSSAFLKLQQKALSSNDSEVITSAKNTALFLINNGVDLFDIVQRVENVDDNEAHDDDQV